MNSAGEVVSGDRDERVGHGDPRLVGAFAPVAGAPASVVVFVYSGGGLCAYIPDHRFRPIVSYR